MSVRSHNNWRVINNSAGWRCFSAALAVSLLLLLFLLTGRGDNARDFAQNAVVGSVVRGPALIRLHSGCCRWWDEWVSLNRRNIKEGISCGARALMDWPFLYQRTRARTHARVCVRVWETGCSGGGLMWGMRSLSGVSMRDFVCAWNKGSRDSVCVRGREGWLHPFCIYLWSALHPCAWAPRVSICVCFWQWFFFFWT